MLVTEYVAFSGRSAGPYILYILFKVYIVIRWLVSPPVLYILYFPSFTYCGGDRGKVKYVICLCLNDKVILLALFLFPFFFRKYTLICPYFMVSKFSNAAEPEPLLELQLLYDQHVRRLINLYKKLIIFIEKMFSMQVRPYPYHYIKLRIKCM